MLDINIEDVKTVLRLCAPYLIALGIVVVLAVISMIACHKMAKGQKFLIRGEAGLAILLTLIIVVNLICFGPMASMINLATGGGSISQESSAEATELCTDIAEEGIVLLKNDGGLLPLAANANLNVFGWASTNPCYGGVGSGSMSDAHPVVTLLQGLTDAGLMLNSELSDFYTAYRADRPAIGIFTQDWTLPEPPADTYPDTLISNAQSHSDTAMVVITRMDGEGADLSRDLSQSTYTNNSESYNDFEPGEHYLQLSRSEEDMVNLVCSNFTNVILVYNGANAFELGFVNDHPQIKSVLWCPNAGQSGFAALGSIITGEVNPSGKTSDTFVADLTATPYFNNFGSFTYDNMDHHPGMLGGNALPPTFVNYVESIYVGYRFYETAADEGLIDYDNTVLYPFGYGLSYTSFQQEMGAISESNGVISVDVTVTNTGSVAGKDVVEIYYDPPYTNGGIEKASVNLVAFDKTDLLQPGDTQTLTLTFNVEDMASYDEQGAGCYVLEAGDYIISLNSDAHTVIEEQTYTVSSTITYGESNKRSTDLIAAVNQFPYAGGDVNFLSRADHFANYEEAVAAPATLSMSDRLEAQFINTENFDLNSHVDPNAAMPVTGANNGLTLTDLRGAAYDDEAWEPLLDQLTVSDMRELMAIGGYQTVAAPSVGKTQQLDCDGPASVNNNFTRQGSIAFPSAVIIACSWNEDLAKAFGDSIGKMANEMDVSGWYAPAMNLHRSAFAGRNFEYYSEDSLLSGRMASNAVQGAGNHGVYAFIKHFALNDQETNRMRMICTWCNEQAMRELYLKPFEICVKDNAAQGGAAAGHPLAVMSSYNYIGPVWAGGSYELLTTVLKDEWGFEGFVETDYFGDQGFGYMNIDQAIRAGGATCLAPMDAGTNYVSDDSSAPALQVMRRACKDILFTVVNSRAYSPENLNPGMPTWQIAAIVADVVLGAAIVAGAVLVFKKSRKI